MSKLEIIKKIEGEQLRNDIPSFRIGDSLKMQLRLIEGGKERMQTFTGTVIARQGSGLSETVTLHRVAFGEGLKRTFLLHSPRIAKMEVVKEGSARRAKLYYLLGSTGKASKVKGKVGGRPKASEESSSSTPEAAQPVDSNV